MAEVDRNYLKKLKTTMEHSLNVARGSFYIYRLNKVEYIKRLYSIYWEVMWVKLNFEFN